MSHLILDTLATVPDLVAFAAHGVALAADNTPAANPDGSVAGSPGIGGFFAISTDEQKHIWPWEDYTLIDSRVPVTLPEHSLSDGIFF